MNKFKYVRHLVPLCLVLLPGLCRADGLGVASAYNLVALGYGNIAGTVSENSDVGGRIAAAGQILNAPEVGQSLINDPYASLAAGYLMVAGGGLGPGEHTNVQSNGKVFAPGATSGNFNFNAGGSLVNSGPSPIDFDSLRTSLDAESLFLGSLLPSGQVLAPGASPNCGSCLVLKGTNATLDVFDLTAAQLASVNNPLDIEVPAGATVIINVSGSVNHAYTLGNGVYIGGNQPSQTSDAGADILFNFDDATSVSLGGQITASLLAPFAVLTGNSSIDGTMIAAQIATNGEVHNAEFAGTLPPSSAAPEPSGLLLLGTGIVGVAGLVRRRSKV